MGLLAYLANDGHGGIRGGSTAEALAQAKPFSLISCLAQPSLAPTPPAWGMNYG